MFILVAITILSCEPENNDFSWERIRERGASSLSVASNGDLWVSTVSSSIYGSTSVYLSKNNGKTWVEKKYNSFSSGGNSIAVNPVNGYLFVFVPGKYGLLRSTDNGENWVKVANYNVIEDIIFTPSGEIYLSTLGYGVYYTGVICYSSNNGDTWIEKKSNGLPSTNNRLYFSFPLGLGRDGTLYGGTYTGVYRSTDGGDTWLPPSNHTNARISGLTVSDDGSIFAVAYSIYVSDTMGVLKSTDRGRTWKLVNANSFVYKGEDVKIIYNPITKDIFWGEAGYSYFYVYRSTDLGASWELKNAGLPDGISIYNFAFSPITGQMYVVSGSGVHRSKNYPK
jgi:photosystem II stability/assembly factor-like uncharacterized protein